MCRNSPAEDVLLWQINAQFFDTRSCFSKSVGAAQLNWNTGNTENTIKKDTSDSVLTGCAAASHIPDEKEIQTD